LLATGERTRKRVPNTTELLTTQEQQVAHLAREGRSNQEIGGQLFTDPKTVDTTSTKRSRIFASGSGISSKRVLLHD
jgi:DNA-binding NarL/FixJ family response regulator